MAHRSVAPKDAVQHPPVIHAGHARGPVRQQRLNHSPLQVGQVVSTHGEHESRLRVREKPPAGKRRTQRPEEAAQLP